MKIVGAASSHDAFAPLLNRIYALPLNVIYYFGDGLKITLQQAAGNLPRKEF